MPAQYSSRLRASPISFSQYANYLVSQLAAPSASNARGGTNAPSAPNATTPPSPDFNIRSKYYQECVDTFGFFEGDQVCGVFAGNPVDWETYYFRYCHVTPTHRGLGLPAWFYAWLISQLQNSGVTKIQTETSPTNGASIRTLSNLKFVVTGNALSQQFGSLLKFTRFCSLQEEAAFVEKFCYP